MLRSLFAGVTGLANHQLKLDVIGNNIANINTLGFKSSRVTFREMLTQTIRGASRPSDGGAGGTNPQQIGLGSSVGSIDTDFSQGNMQITGIMTDMAIEGEGFFVLSDGFTQYYTRDGAFSLDGAGNMINPGNGFKLQGVLADDYGVIQQGRGIEDIVIPTTLVVPANATSRVQVRGNLHVDSDALGSISKSGTLLTVSGGTDLLRELNNGEGNSIGLSTGDEITIHATINGTDIDQTFTVAQGSTLQDLADSIQTALRSVDASVNVNVVSTGQIQVEAVANDISNLLIQSRGNTYFNSAFSNSDLITAGTSGLTNATLHSSAEGGDLLANLRDKNGVELGISNNITINGFRGGTAVDSVILDFDPAVTTLDDLTNAISDAFNITFGSVEIDSSGSIVINGDVGADFGITSIEIDEVGESNSVLKSAMTFQDVQEARDTTTYGVTTMVYDSLGGVHNLTIHFSKIFGENNWNWDASIDGMGEILEGGSGSAQFTDGGLLSSFTNDSPGGRLVVDLHNGSELLSMSIDPGDIGSLNSLIQFNSDFSIRATDMDGQGMGSLETISIDRNGVINGQFSNGMNRDLAQIAMADFNNPSGLNRVGENMFILSPNSGTANVVYAGTNARGMITPGELEMSNVDLAGQFTEMITAQRGFQANARIISVGDQMLTELVNLKK